MLRLLGVQGMVPTGRLLEPHVLRLLGVLGSVPAAREVGHRVKRHGVQSDLPVLVLLCCVVDLLHRMW